MDVKTAFIYGDVDSEILFTYPVNLPKGMRHKDFYLLREEIYGLKRSLLLKYRKIVAALKQLGFVLLAETEAVFDKMEDDETRALNPCHF